MSCTFEPINHPREFTEAELYGERCKLLEPTFAMEERGVSINKQRMADTLTQYRSDVLELAEICVNLTDGYLTKLPKGTSDVLRKTFFEHFNLKATKKTKSGLKDSTDKKELENWITTLPKTSKARAFIKRLSEKRKRDTAISYMEGYQKAGLSLPLNFTSYKKGQWINDYILIHPSFNIGGTDTTRLSCNDPNAQNISKQKGFNLRYIFGPVPGREWFSMDYENIEIRIPAFETGEPALVKLFKEGGSYHMLVASILVPQLVADCEARVRSAPPGDKAKYKFQEYFKSTWYQWIKNGNFAIQYGAQKAKADSTFHIDGAYERLRSQFPRITALGDYMVQLANETGGITCIGGYPLRCPRDDYGRIEPTKPLNYHVQGTAGWCMILALNRVYEYLRQFPDHHMVMTIHDEIVFDFPAQHKDNLKILRMCKRLMEQSGEDIDIPVPVSVSYHPDNWATKDERIAL